jgi:hypothetical protein
MIAILTIHVGNIIPPPPVRQCYQPSVRLKAIRKVSVLGLEPDLHEPGAPFNDAVIGDLPRSNTFPFNLGVDA